MAPLISPDRVFKVHARQHDFEVVLNRVHPCRRCFNFLLSQTSLLKLCPRLVLSLQPQDCRLVARPLLASPELSVPLKEWLRHVPYYLCTICEPLSDI